MGVGLGLFFNKAIVDAKLVSDGKTLYACSQSLDEITKARGLAPAFSTFILDPEAMIDDLPDGELIEETWHNSRDGLRVVTGLIAAIEAPEGKPRKTIDQRGGPSTPLPRTLGSKSGMKGRRAADLLSQLKDLERCLKLAVKKQARFYLLTC